MNVIILAAGSGTRFGSSEPKCLSLIQGEPNITRLIRQIKTHLPQANIKVILGHNAAVLEKHLEGPDVGYIFNDRYLEDKNLWSGLLGVKASKDGALIIEADCVYSDSAFLSMAQTVTSRSESILFLGEQTSSLSTCATIQTRDEKFLDFIIGKRQNVVGKEHFDMAGALRVSKQDVSTFIKKCELLAEDSLDQYYFESVTKYSSAFNLKCVQISGKRYTFNTKDEYNEVLANIDYSAMKNEPPITFVDPNTLKHIEGFSKKRAMWLKDKVLQEKQWTQPVCIDPTGLVMDGQHRMEVAKMLKLKQIPAMVFDYENVEIYSLRKSHKVSIELIRQNAATQQEYPYKTVKHRFPCEINKCQIDLTSLYEN